MHLQVGDVGQVSQAVDVASTGARRSEHAADVDAVERGHIGGVGGRGGEQVVGVPELKCDKKRVREGRHALHDDLDGLHHAMHHDVGKSDVLHVPKANVMILLCISSPWQLTRHAPAWI